MARNLFVVMRVCSPVALSYLDAGFEPRCPRKDFLIACCLLLLAVAKMCCSPLDLRRGVKPRQGKPSSVKKKILLMRPWVGERGGGGQTALRGLEGSRYLGGHCGGQRTKTVAHVFTGPSSQQKWRSLNAPKVRTQLALPFTLRPLPPRSPRWGGSL